MRALSEGSMIEPNGGPPSRLNLPHDVLFQRQNEPRRKTVLLEVKNDQVPETQQTDKKLHEWRG